MKNADAIFSNACDLNNIPVGDISSSSFTWADDLDHLPTLQTIISGYGVCNLDPRKLKHEK